MNETPQHVWTNSRGVTYRSRSTRGVVFSGQERANGDPLLGTPDQWRRRGYALALDPHGYEYPAPFDCVVTQQPDGSWVGCDTFNGRRRRFVRKDATSPWIEDKSDATVAHAATQTQPLHAGDTPWVLPGGATFDRRGGRGLVLDTCRAWPDEYLRGQAPSLWITGEPGRGKSQIAAWLIADLARRSIVVDRWVMPATIRTMRRGYTDDPHGLAARQEHRTAVDRACKVPVLVIEDVSADRKAEDVRQLLYDVLDARAGWRLPLIVTDNATPDALEAAGWDARIVSRLRSAMVLDLRGPDFRAQPRLAM